MRRHRLNPQSKTLWWALGLGAAGTAAYFLFRKTVPAARQAPPGPDAGLEERRAKLLPLFRAAAHKHGVPLAWLLALAHRESAFRNTRSKSGAGDDRRGGAWGPLQMTSATAADLGYRAQATLEERGTAILADPGIGIDLGARYVARLIKRFGQDLAKVAAGYNAGPGAVQRGQVPASTRERYVPSVLALADRYASVT